MDSKSSSKLTVASSKEKRGRESLMKAKSIHSNLVKLHSKSDFTGKSCELTRVVTESVEHYSSLHSLLVTMEQRQVKDYINESTLDDLNTLLAFTNILLLPQLSLKLADFIIFLCEKHFETDTIKLHHSLFIKTAILLEEHGVHSIVRDHVGMLDRVMVDGKDRKVILAQLKCKLSLVCILLHKGKIAECVKLLISILSHPVCAMYRSNVLELLSICASVLGDVLQTIKPVHGKEDFLKFLLTQLRGSCDIIQCPCNHPNAFQLTSLECQIYSLTLIKSIDYKRTSPTDLSIVSNLLQSLYKLSDMYIEAGLMKEAIKYNSDGLEMCQLLYLSNWYIRFLIQEAVISDLTSVPSCEKIVQFKFGINDISDDTIIRIALDTDCSRVSLSMLDVMTNYFINSSSPSHALTIINHVEMKLSLCTSYDEVILPYMIDNLQLKVRALLATDRVQEAIDVAKHDIFTGNIAQNHCHMSAVRLSLAKLHYHIGRAILKSIDDTDIADKIWNGTNFEDKSDQMTLDYLPSKLRSLLDHLLVSCQYLSPVTLSTCLARDVYRLLGVCLSSWRNDLASHFLLLSSSISLEHDAVFWFGKKLRQEESGSISANSIINDMLSTLRFSPLPSKLNRARLMLYPLPHPWPLSHTQQLISDLPHDWIHCTLSLMERSEDVKVLVIVRVKRDRDNIIVKIPITNHDCECFKGEFSKLMTDNVTSAALTDKSSWWTTRRSLDQQLEKLLLKIEMKWLGKWKLILSPALSSLSKSSTDRIVKLLRNHRVHYGTLAWTEILMAGAKIFNLNDSLREVFNDEIISAISRTRKFTVSQNKLILSLDRNVHSFPWENIPLLYNEKISRIPSLSFLLAVKSLHFTNDSEIDPSKTFFVVNPSGDLVNTEKNFAWFEHEEDWKGVVGRPPTRDEFIDGLRDYDTFIYCGHGKAREYFDRNDKVQKLAVSATILQMGCSSGKLETLGRQLDPRGMALNLLIAGCPLLVSNLWDVTDKDIDRFCDFVIRNWLKDRKSQLMLSVSEARNKCRLKFLIGSSPVVYGIPYDL